MLYGFRQKKEIYKEMGSLSERTLEARNKKYKVILAEELFMNLASVSIDNWKTIKYSNLNLDNMLVLIGQNNSG
ncbi:MAG: hypothetical protein ACRCVS_05785, partial [Fusobacteriaceae bacterium]